MIDRNQAGRDKSPTWPAWAGQRSPFPELLFDGAAEYYEQRDNQGDNAALLVAIASYGELLEEQRRERIPLQWATTQNKLGNALATLGERESGTARLEGAVTAYREALKERTRERAAVAVGNDAEQPRPRAFEVRRTRERDGAVRGSGKRLPRAVMQRPM